MICEWGEPMFYYLYGLQSFYIFDEFHSLAHKGSLYMVSWNTLGFKSAAQATATIHIPRPQWLLLKLTDESSFADQFLRV